jgi:drug/metabolite transporter (DMT)-like permease
MLVKLLLILISINTVASQLLVKKGVTVLGGIKTASDFPHMIASAITSPWIIVSIFLQIVGYLMWFLVVTREKLGVAVAITGSSFYVLMALSAWYFYGETLTALQWIGISLIIAGVICVGIRVA